MSEIIKYMFLIIFLLVVFAIVWILRDGINVRHGGAFSMAQNRTGALSSCRDID
ncbi:MAG: hypothetical protein KDA72_03555 [Planctomycetales bacterium]|nr:hypothetical protein [Planctomycetales bacterium]